MRLFRVVLVALCVAAAGLVVSSGTASATPTPVQPPTVDKLFAQSTIPLNGTTFVSVAVSNPNEIATLTGITVTDTLPPGLVATNPSSGPGCGGTAVVTANSISLTNGTLGPGAGCSLEFEVRATTLGTKVNITSPVTSSNGGTGAPATATLVVANLPPTLTKSFSPSTVAVGGTTTLTFTLTNPNPSLALSRITFADPFPPGLAVAANPAVSNNCGGVPSVGPFALAVAYANASLPPGGSCTFSVNVTAGSTGAKNNTTTIVSSSAGIGSPATGTLTVSLTTAPSAIRLVNQIPVAVSPVAEFRLFANNQPIARIGVHSGGEASVPTSGGAPPWSAFAIVNGITTATVTILNPNATVTAYSDAAGSPFLVVS
jgi:uncharacterized repeat protein (TIGR01451 family)